jgi:hypothetical protein
MNMKILITAFIALISLSAEPVLAQINPGDFTTPNSGIELKPEFPLPGDTVTATFNDYSGSTYGSSVVWMINGEVVAGSENQRQITFQTGDSGTTQTIQAVLNKPSGGQVVLESTIKPVYLDIIIESQTRVPDWYLGRSLPSIGSLVNATALVSSGSILDTDLIYTWRVGQKVLEGGPIRGRNQVSFTTPMGSQTVLSLQVATPDGVTLAKRAILLPSVTPELHFYEVSTLFGTNHVALSDNFSLIGQSAVVKAEPYHLDSRVYNNPDIKEWSIDGRGSGTVDNNPYEVTLKRVGGSGPVDLEFHVRSTSQVLQGVEDNIRVNF